MTLTETFKIIAVLKANYPFMDKGLTIDEIEGRTNLWAEMFADDDYRIVGGAVKAYIANDETGYAPNVGQIKSYIRKLTEPDEMTEQEAVNLILKAAANSGYNSQAEFEKLPPVLQRLVGSPSQLKEWALMDSSVVNSVVSSNLMRSFKAVAQQEKEIKALPSSVRQILQIASDGVKMIE